MVHDDKGDWVKYTDIARGVSMTESMIVELVSGNQEIIPENHYFRIGPEGVLFVLDKDENLFVAYAPHTWISYRPFSR
jgi:hypothetical protein